MKKFLLVLISIFFLVSICKASHFKKFLDFKAKYNKNYSSNIELLNRFKIYKQNVEMIKRMNRESTSAKFGVNQFADMSQNE